MAVWDWFLSLFDRNTNTLKLDTQVGLLTAEVYFKKLAIQSCINLIANTVARGEFLTYLKGEEVRKDNYYLLNVEPNQNKSASKFWRNVISKLVLDNECLVIEQSGKFYVADSFQPKEFAFLENIYTDIVIGDLKLNRPYKESEVFRFELHNEEIRPVVEGLYISYAKLIAASQDNYKKSRAKRGTLELESTYPQTQKAQEDLTNLLDIRFKRFFEAEGNAVIPLAKGMKYNELNSKTATGSSSTESRDIRALVDDVFDFTAIAFQVPPPLLKGNVADSDKAMSNFLTFCINPMGELITDEINRKYYGKAAYLEKTYTRLDVSRVKAVDIKEIANSLDILERIGAFCVDDSLKVLGMEPLNTEWSRARWMTKNYEPIETRLKGGEKQ
ncbi:phage portal protein [Sporomusa sp. KB1]|jgi:HK97 family phage portal protein|uniref:phage portal protein n=1 Tax=Sporomusa sp. KB1 TaxID=943346 RepID=UPI0011A9286E|nr:phage portal protein [Sporomusa sp. KB1]TWH49601.1 HK97 family phage portal protein [Sporomusa sp. KB1]